MLNKGKIGITTTIPVEVIFAAGYIPVDLNNVFISHPDSYHLVEKAEEVGFPRNFCAWIKGIYSVAISDGELKAIVGVTQGDCSNTHALMEVFELEGLRVIPFAFPSNGDRKALLHEIEKLMRTLNVSWEKVKLIKAELDRVRNLAQEIDYLTWHDRKVRGAENHLYLVNCSDFKGDYEAYRKELSLFLEEARKREPLSIKIPLGYIGVPPIFTDLYDFVESLGACIVYNEVQHQYTMPDRVTDLIEQYLTYTYPYGIFTRLRSIRREIARRQIKGLIHYVQSFCFRQAEDIILRRELSLPILTIEGDRPGKLDSRTRLRIEAFVETLREREQFRVSTH